MERLTSKTAQLLRERFGKDSILALATVEDGVPFVRNVDAYYADGAFYIITHRLSNKMRQIRKDPAVAIAGDWFTAHGRGVDLGPFGRPENAAIAQTLRTVFASWLDNGHSDLNDPNTCILCIRLTDGTLFAHGTRYDIDFTAPQP